MTITLADDVERFLQDQVRAGACQNPSELVNAVLRSLRDLESSPFQSNPELEAWLLETADHPTTPLTKSDFDGIRARVLAAAKSPAS